MLTLLLGFLGFLILSAVGLVWPGREHWAWISLLGLVGFIGTVVPLNLWIKKKMEAVFARMQKVLLDSRDQLYRNMNQMQKGFSGSPKAIQALLEKKQGASIQEALAVLDDIRPLQKWNLLAERQANTVRAQLYFQLKDFANADRYLKKCFILDPFTTAIRLVRLYETNTAPAKLDKAFTKALARFKKSKDAPILYALYSWILVKKDRVQEAMELLSTAKDTTGNEFLKANWEHLANGRVRQFSNSGFAETWYALHLETPKMKQERRQQPMYR